MAGGLDDLRGDWKYGDYERVRDSCRYSLESLNIDHLTLLEHASYEYESGRGSLRQRDRGFHLKEAAFRSELRNLRRLKLDILIKDIITGKQSIYGLSQEHQDPNSLLQYIFRLTWQYEEPIPKGSSVDLNLLEQSLAAIEESLKTPSQEAQIVAMSVISQVEDEKVRYALQYGLTYLTAASLKIHRQASEFIAKCLLYKEDKGSVADIIVSVYEGKQEDQIIRSGDIDWEEVVKNAKRACLGHLAREDELGNYALAIYINDYPGTRENRRTPEQRYWGESIGLGIAIALIAYFNGYKIKPGIAFTGMVRPGIDAIGEVGGFDGEGKAYAACWSGIEKIIIPKDNVDKAKQEIERAHEDQAGCNTIVVGVTYLSEAEDAAFQSVISLDHDEKVIRKFPFPIARKYQQSPPGVGERKERYLYQVLTTILQYLSLILISQYVIRDADREEIRNPDLTGWLYSKIGSEMVSGTWGNIFLRILKHYIEIHQRDQSGLFITELYNISGGEYDYVKKTIDRVMALRHNYNDGNLPTNEEEWQELISQYTAALEVILEKFSFLKDYDLIRVVDRQDDSYFYHRYMGSQTDIEKYEKPYPSEQELIPGQIYLAKRDYSDLLHLHPLLIFWDLPTDVMMYHESGAKEVRYQQSFRAGFFGSPAHLSEILAIYDRLKKEKERKTSFEDLEWERLKEIVRGISHVRDFDSGIYFQRDDAIQALQQFLGSDKTCMIVSGDAGSGKTSLLCSLNDELSGDPDACVLVYPARGFRKRSLEEILSDVLIQDDEGDKNTFISRMARTQILNGRKLIICIDAINEHENPKQLLASLDQTIEKNRDPWLKLIITCRTNVWRRLAPPIVHLTEIRYYREGDSNDIAVYLHEFGAAELPHVYERYRTKYGLQTLYDKLSPGVQRLIKDPLMLSLIAESYRGEVIPTVGFSMNSIYRKYVTRLEEKGRLVQDRDQQFLTEQLVPLMADSGNYTNEISSEQIRERLVSIPGLDGEIPLRELMYSYDEEKLKTPYIRLLDAGILREAGDPMNRTIQFRIERLYEFFLGEYIHKNEIRALPKTQAKVAKFQRLVDKARELPYFWGVVRQALLMDKDKGNILKQLAQTTDWVVRNMTVDCLNSLARDHDDIDTAVSIASDLMTYSGKSATAENARVVAIQLASELWGAYSLAELKTANEEELLRMLMGILEKGIYDRSKAIRETAQQYIYYLSVENPGAVLKVLDSISKNIGATWHILRLIKSLAACGVVSLLMYCDIIEADTNEQTIKQDTLKHLHEMWKGIIKRCKPVLRLALWGMKAFSSFIMQKNVGVSDPFNLLELKRFFRTLSDEERNVIIELTPYLKLERQDLPSASDTIVNVMRRSDMFSFYHVILIFVAQASIGNIDEIFRISERIYQEGSDFSKGFLSWPLSEVIRADYSRFESYRILMKNYLEDVNNWWIPSKAGKEYCPYTLSELIANCVEANGDDSLIDMHKYLEAARGNPKLLWFIIRNMRALAIYYNKPSIAIENFRWLIGNVSDQKAREHLIAALADIKIYYPEAIEGLLQAADDKLSSMERETIRSAKSSELMGHLIGVKLAVIYRNSHLRNAAADVFAVAPQCKNLGTWINQALRRIVNFVMGEDILKVIPLDGED